MKGIRAADRVFGARYRVERSLKEGGGTATYLGTDLQTDRQVVIKTAAGSPGLAGGELRLRHEADVLSEIESTWLAPLLELGFEGDHAYMVTAFVPGETLEQRLRRGPLEPRDAISLGRCVTSALQAVHELGVLHGQVKPANVVLGDEIPLERATLIDFGLFTGVQLDAPPREKPPDAVRYVAPERAGLINQPIDERSDLYAVGVLLFEAIAGRPPFDGATVGEVLRQHLTVYPPDLRSLGREVPRALAEVVQRLLWKEPRDRYQSAEAVAADLAALGEALDGGVADPSIVVGLHDRRTTLTEPAFVGRGSELRLLDEQLERAASGHGGLVLLESESGGGKTRLLEEMAQRAGWGTWVLRGQGLDESAQRPFQVLEGVVKGILAAADSEAEIGAALRERLGDERLAVADALPELAPVLGPVAPGSFGPEAHGEARSLHALAALLEALGTAQRPALLVLDDCQWADELTTKLLGHWQRGRNGRRHVTVVAAFRTEEVPENHALRLAKPSLHIVMPAFDEDEIRRLVESMAGPVPEEAFAQVARLARGNPFMAAAVLRGLFESGALVDETAGWRVEADALADVQSSRRAAALLTRRLRLLPPEALELLTAGAIIGRRFDLALAAGLVGLAPQQAWKAVTGARRRHIVWARPESGHYVFVHDKLRETLLELTPPGDRRDFHRRAAAEIEREHPERVFELAYHFEEAGEDERALSYALAAAEQSRAQHALEVAERYYRVAERGARASDRATRCRIAEGLGDVLMLRGRYDEADEQFALARSLAEGTAAQARIESKTGELAFKRGDYERAREACIRGLRLLGRRTPRSSALVAVLFLEELAIHLAHRLLPRHFLGRRELGTPRAEQDLLAVRLYDRLVYVWYFAEGRKLGAGWATLRSVNLAERYRPTEELGHVYSVLGNVAGGGFPPLAGWGLGLRERAREIRESLGNLYGRGQQLAYHWVLAAAVSEYEDGIVQAREGRRLLRLTGDQWDVNAASWGISLCSYLKGDLRAAIDEAKNLHREAEAISDFQNMGNALWVWAQASRGNLPREPIHALLQQDIFQTTRVSLLGAHGLRLLADGQPEDALVPLAEARRLAVRRRLIDTLVESVVPWLATALRIAVETTPPLAFERRQALLRRAGRIAWEARLFARIFRLSLPHALRESGRIAALRGNARRARRFLDRSLAVAERRGMRYERAETLHARGEIGLAVGWPGAADDAAEAERELRALLPAGEPERPSPPPEVTLSLADRFETILDAGRRIASALSRDLIFAAVREAALTLLRGEECAVLLADDVEGDGYRPLALHALAAGRPVVFGEEAVEGGESAFLAGVQSALCAPIFARGRAVASFCVVHRQVSGLFGEEEERLAGFIATLAGAALENAEGFSEVEALSRTLEKRVEERTAELGEANRRLSELDTLKNEFLSRASHELRTPLTVVAGMGVTLERRWEALDEKQRVQLLHALNRSAKSLEDIVTTLLDFSRIEAGLALHPERLDLGELLTGVAARMEHLFTTHELALEVERELVVVADPMLLDRVAENLLANAAKHTPASTRVVLSAGREGTDAVVAVSDDGPGVPATELQRLGDRFFRGAGSGGTSGLGLGLALVREVLDLHGSALEVTSEVGRGARFAFRLPLQAGV